MGHTPFEDISTDKEDFFDEGFDVFTIVSITHSTQRVRVFTIRFQDRYAPFFSRFNNDVVNRIST